MLESKLKSKLYNIKTIAGPYLHKRDQRRYVIIYLLNGTQLSMTYARYLMQEYLGRILNSNEEVDHKDEDKLNDSIENLQVLNKILHKQLSKTNRIYETLKINCAYCEKEFIMSPRQQAKRNCLQPKTGPFCTKKCSALSRNQN